MADKPLHILRGVPPNVNGRPCSLERFFRLCDVWNERGALFGSWTRRGPRRVDELKGGSVYFVHEKATLFRMPLYGIEKVRDFKPDVEEKYLNHSAFVCLPRIIKVKAKTVKFLRGWRYLEDKDAPPDLQDVPYDPIPSEEEMLGYG